MRSLLSFCILTLPHGNRTDLYHWPRWQGAEVKTGGSILSNQQPTTYNMDRNSHESRIRRRKPRGSTYIRVGGVRTLSFTLVYYFAPFHDEGEDFDERARKDSHDSLASETICYHRLQFWPLGCRGEGNCFL